ncbi:MAG: UDP-glucose/GDP-mannose dehydrogenase family protein [Bacteroidota bacterium]|nr:UDP-glucose/GDP-mannose dehydrogenase family protein [Bacteroidota bacterium]
MNIVIVGSGYVGLVSGVCFAEMGVNVTCVDVNKEKINKLQKGIIPIYEPGLEEMVKKNMQAKRLSFSTSLSSCIKEAELVFSAVGTPESEDGGADLSFVYQVAREFGQNIDKYTVLVIKSTVPVGTSKTIKQIINEELDKRGEKIPFDVANNPEFLKEGVAIKDFMSPDRVVIGVESQRAKELLTQLYRPFLLNNFRVIFTDIPSAEMIKYASNAMLATRISFMNDIANLCEKVGADVNMVRKGVGADTRIGSKFLYPGCGYGGSCFPKDVKALIKTAKDVGYEMRVLQAVEQVNSYQKQIVFNKLYDFYKGELKDKNICVWGLSFKPETDDMREATSLVIIDKLLKAGCRVKVYDPVAMKECYNRLQDKVIYAKDMYQAVEQADALLLLTEWKEFRLPSWQILKNKMKKPLIIDGRNIYDAKELEKEGFDYFCIGK